MNALLEVTDYTQQPIDGFLNKLSFGGMMLIIGMLAVFVVLVIIWAFLAAFSRLSHRKKTAKPAPKQEIRNETYHKNTADERELIAVLAAAVYAAESENNGLKFRVVSFRKK